MSPFEVDHVWSPRNAVDFISGSESSFKSVDDLKKKFKGSLDDAKFSRRIAKLRQSAEASMRYKEPNCTVLQNVWVNLTLLQNAHFKLKESQLLSSKLVCPFAIT